MTAEIISPWVLVAWGILVGLDIGLLGLWLIAERLAPAEAYPWWPLEISPLFVSGAPVLAVIAIYIETIVAFAAPYVGGLARILWALIRVFVGV